MSTKMWKRLLAVLLILLVCAFPVMASEDQDLISVDKQVQQKVEYTTVQVRTGTFIKEVRYTAEAYTPLTCAVTYYGSKSALVEYTVTLGSTVKRGDVIAKVSALKDENMIASLQQELSNAKKQLQAGVEQRENEIAALRAQISSITDSYEKQLQNLQLEMLQTELKQYKYLQQRTIDACAEALEQEKNRQGQQELTSPIDGVVTQLAEKNAGDVVYNAENLAVISSTKDVMLRVANPSLELRYNMPVSVTVGRGDQQFTMTGVVIAADDALEAKYRSGYAYIRLDAKEDEELVLIDLRVVAETMRLERVLLVDRNAVVSENGKHYVTRLEGSMLQHRYVLFGASNVTDTWIIAGVAEGDTLVVE